MSFDSIQQIESRMASIEAKLSEVFGKAETDNQFFSKMLSEKLNPMPVNMSEPVSKMVEDMATKHGLDPKLLHAVMMQESGGNPSAVSHSGAMGLMQLMPGTAKALGVSDPYNPEQNLDGGAKYLKGLMDKFGSVPLALAAYNAGPGAVQKYGEIPPYAETQNYVKRIMSHL